jgi:hypothetical protein
MYAIDKKYGLNTFTLQASRMAAQLQYRAGHIVSSVNVDLRPIRMLCKYFSPLPKKPALPPFSRFSQPTQAESINKQ